MSDVVLINVARDFSPFPGGRFLQDGDYSGERFRKEQLVPALRSGASLVVVELDGAMGYGSSFLEEAFGGLVRVEGFMRKDLLKRLRLVSPARPWLEREVVHYIDSAKSSSGGRRE